jgi:putative tryptophan/tyrosine transport system substrate-binding protein
MKRKITVLTLCAILLALCSVAHAQQPKKLFRIGLHTGGGGNAKNPGRYFEVFCQSLHDLGYVEGKNLRIEYRFADGKGAAREAQLAEELVQQNLDAIVITTRPAIQAAMNASKTIPIVMVTSADPVAAGLVKSLARPGGNVTGVTRMTRELGGKRLELLKEMLPGLSRVGILMASDASTGEEDFKQFEAEARALKLPVTRLVIRPDKPEIAATFDAAVKARTGALVAMSYGVVNRNAKLIAELGVKKRMPIMFERSEFVDGAD